MQATVQAAPAVARALREHDLSNQQVTELLDLLDALGLKLEPMHPHTDDPTLGSYFILDLLDEASADEVISRVRQSEAIEAAYVKPPDELPDDT